jgi:sugar/nucleoside kinase (ribokinase family)
MVRIAILGDIRMEYRAKLSEAAFTSISENLLDYADIDATVAGTATNFARHAVRYFDEVAVVSKLGNDQFTETIIRYFEKIGVSLHAPVDDEVSNGLSIVLRDNNQQLAHGVRILVASATPYGRISPVDIHTVRDVVRGAKVVALDGYLLLSDLGVDVALAVADIVQDSGGSLYFDVVPHNVERFLDLQELRRVVSHANIVDSELPTAHILAGIKYDEENFRKDGVLPIASKLSRLSRSDAVWFLRGGLDNLGETYVCQGGSLLARYSHPRPSWVGPNGFGNLLAAIELSHLIREGVPLGNLDFDLAREVTL